MNPKVLKVFVTVLSSINVLCRVEGSITKWVPVGASQSSFAYPNLHLADVCIDNDVGEPCICDGNNCCLTAPGSNTWLKFDLGQVRNVKLVKVTGRYDHQDLQQSRDINIKVSVTDNLNEALTCATSQDFQGVTQKEVNCQTEDLQGRYVWFLKNDAIALCEVEIFGMNETTTEIQDPAHQKFLSQNYNVSLSNITFADGGGNFQLNFEYDIGENATKGRFTLFQKGCNTANEVSDVLSPHEMTKDISEISNGHVLQVQIEKEKFGSSPLVTKGSDGDSSGVLEFCAQMESLLGDETSVTFLKSDISLSYDLTKNQFSLTDNKIKADDIVQKNTTVTTVYGIKAYRCGPSDFQQRKDTLQQNGLVGICLKPNSTSNDATDISNFEMRFKQNDVEIFKAADYGTDGPITPTTLSVISKNGQTYKVVSRLVSNLFENGKDVFEVTGNAFLVFKERQLVTGKVPNLRQLGEDLEDLAGNAAFSLPVEIQKVASVDSDDETKGYFIFSFIGAALAITIGSILYKKLV